MMNAIVDLAVAQADRASRSSRFGKSLFTQGSLLAVAHANPLVPIVVDHDASRVVGSVTGWRVVGDRLVAQARLSEDLPWLALGSGVSLEATLDSTRLDSLGVIRVLGLSVDAVSLLTAGPGALPGSGVVRIERADSPVSALSAAARQAMEGEYVHQARREPCPECGLLGWHQHVGVNA